MNFSSGYIYLFFAIILGISGTTWTFGGYRDLIKDLSEKSQELPALNEGDIVDIINANSEEKFTTPPNRYSSTSLINKLEELGIGRPSTFSSLIDKIQEREYVKKGNIKGKKINCTEFELIEHELSEIECQREFGNEKNKLIIPQSYILSQKFIMILV